MIRVKLTATRNRTSRSGVLTSEFAMANDGRCDYGSTRKRFVICGGRQLLGGGAIGKGLLWKVWINGESPLTVPNEPLSFEKLALTAAYCFESTTLIREIDCQYLNRQNEFIHSGLTVQQPQRELSSASADVFLP